MNDDLKDEGQQLTPAAIGQLINNQARDLELRAIELEIERQRDRDTAEISRAAIDAQVEDRRHERETQREMQKDRQRTAAIIIVVVAALIAMTIWLGAKELGLELVKLCAYVSAGALGGYGYAKKNSSRSDEQE